MTTYLTASPASGAATVTLIELAAVEKVFRSGKAGGRVQARRGAPVHVSLRPERLREKVRA